MATPIWRLNNQIYLFGTIHVNSEDVNPLDKKIFDLIKQSDVLIVENNISQYSHSEIIDLNSKYARNSKLNYAEILPKKVYDIIVDLLTIWDLDIKVFEHYPIWMLENQILNIIFSAYGLIENSGIDENLIEFAQKNEIPIDEFETRKDQLDSFEKFSDEDQLASLCKTINELKQIQIEYFKLCNAYSNGDVNFLEKLLFDPVEGEYLTKKEFRVFVKDRTDVFVDKINSVADKKVPAFIAVGIKHLLGPYGIIEIMNNAGLVLERLI